LRQHHEDKAHGAGKRLQNLEFNANLDEQDKNSSLHQIHHEECVQWIKTYPGLFDFETI
jgi:hypothetical protein